MSCRQDDKCHYNYDYPQSIAKYWFSLAFSPSTSVMHPAAEETVTTAHCLCRQNLHPLTTKICRGFENTRDHEGKLKDINTKKGKRNPKTEVKGMTKSNLFNLCNINLRNLFTMFLNGRNTPASCLYLSYTCSTVQ